MTHIQKVSPKGKLFQITKLFKTESENIFLFPCCRIGANRSVIMWDHIKNKSGRMNKICAYNMLYLKNTLDMPSKTNMVFSKKQLTNSPGKMYKLQQLCQPMFH